MALLTDKPLDEDLLRRQVATAASGALVSFAGVVRNENEGKGVLRIEYEAAPDLALAAMNRLEDEARRQFRIEGIIIAHRTGVLEVGEASVVIVVAAGHRPAAFEACRWAIDRLKETVPVWKKEHFEGGGAEWVAGVKLKA